MKITLPYPPSANRYLRHTARGTYRTAEANAYREQAQWSAKAAGARVSMKPIWLVASLHPRMTVNGKASRTVLDLDNCLKVAIDALQGVAFENDKQLVLIQLEYGAAMLGGGLTLEVVEV